MRLLGSVAAAMALLACGWASWDRGREWSAWQAGLEAGGVDFLRGVAPGEIPREPAAFRQLAHLHGEQLVPADRALALEFLARGLALDPLRSELWILASRQLYFTGELEGAGVALRRSDELNPAFPLQRLKAVQMWDLMGERERAVDVAVSVARLDFEGKREAAQVLRLLDHSPAEAFVAVGGPGCEPAQMAQLMNDLRSSRREAMQELFAQVPEEAWKDEGFQRRAAGLAEKPFLHEVAMRLWRMEGSGDDGGVIASPGGGGEAPGMLDLSRDPFEGAARSYGWVRPTGMGGVVWRWSPLEGAGQPPGAIELRFRRHSGNPEAVERWSVYREPSAGRPGGVVVRLMVQLDPPRRSDLRLSARLGGATAQSEAASTEEDGWQVLEAILPPTEEPGVLEVSLSRKWRGSPSVEDAVVRVGPLELGTPGEPR